MKVFVTHASWRARGEGGPEVENTLRLETGIPTDAHAREGFNPPVRWPETGSNF